MNDSANRKAGRPRKSNGPVDRHIKIDRDLLEAVERPGCNLSNAVRRALRMYLKIEEPGNIKASAIRIRELKSEMARINRELSEEREHLKTLGVKNIHEFEESLEIWE
jgi:hypothetical protein